METEKWIDKGWDVIVNFGPKVLAAIAIWIIGGVIVKYLLKGFNKAMEKKGLEISLKKFLSDLVGWGLKIVLILVVLGTVGVETTSFAAILAAAGLAIGLALQGSLANFAGGILIMIFKPFKIGDFIEAQGQSGTVKEIEIFTTKLLTPNNQEVIINKKYKFENKYFDSPEVLKEKILNKTVIPHQVEFQPGALGKKICWLSCPYCYGESAINTSASARCAA